MERRVPNETGSGRVRIEAAGVLWLSLSIFAACGQTHHEEGGEAAVQVQAVRVEEQPIDEAREFIAQLNSRQSLKLSPQVAGYLKHIDVQAGAHVKEGQTLFEIDSARDQAQLNNYLAVREARRAALNLARAQYERDTKLAPHGVVSQQELDQAKSNLESTQADLDAAEAQVRAQQVQLGYFRIAAPSEGVVGDIPVKVGDYVSPQTVLTLFNQNRALEAYVNIPLSLAPRVNPQTLIQILDEDGHKVSESPVSFISPSADPATQAVLIKAMVDNSAKGELKQSQYVRARVVLGRRSVVTVPSVAVFRQVGQYFVYVVKPQAGGDTVEQRAVQLGDLVGNVYVVRDGLKSGEQVITAGTQKLREGARVKVGA
jgi:RND family efflux transporter MFP subunit